MPDPSNREGQQSSELESRTRPETAAPTGERTPLREGHGESRMPSFNAWRTMRNAEREIRANGAPPVSSTVVGNDAGTSEIVLSFDSSYEATQRRTSPRP